MNIRNACLAITLASIGHLLPAQTVYYGSSADGSSLLQSRLDFGGSSEFLRSDNVPTAQSTNFRFNFSENSMRVTNQVLIVPDITTTQTIEQTVGPGQTDQWHFSATLHGFTTQPIDISDSPITPGSNGLYNLDDNGWYNGDYARYTDVTVTFDWEIIGPTESKSGTESTDLSISNEFFWFTQLDTVNFPDSMSLSGINNRQVRWNDSDSNTSALNTTVDGLNLEWDIRNLRVSLTDGGSSLGAVTAVPEPAYATMLAGLMTCFYFVASRRGKMN